MIDKSNAIALLDRLRNEIPSLQTKPRLSNEFRLWHYEVIKALETVFGQSSIAKEEFLQLSFEIHSEILKQAPEQIRAILKEKFNINIPDDIEIPQDHFFQERLSNANEFLLAMIKKIDCS